MRMIICACLGVALVSSASWADDPPQGPGGVIEQLNQDVAEIERRADIQIADVMRRVYAIEDQAAEEARELTVAAIEDLKAIQEEFTRDGKLDEALAVREMVRTMEDELDGVEVLENPGIISYDSEPGAVYYFRVTGDADYASIWGTGVYTYDSQIAVTAVHSGVLRDGENGVVRVTVMPGLEHYEGSERHGVTSSRYSSYDLSYRIEAPGPVVRAQVRQADRDQQPPANSDSPGSN